MRKLETLRKQTTSVTFSQLQEHIKANVFWVNFFLDDVLLSKQEILEMCKLTNQKVICWDYVSMIAITESLQGKIK